MRLVFIPLALFPATAAMAQEPFLNGASAAGELRLGRFESETMSTGFLYGDLTLSWGRGDWAVNLGAFGVVGRPHETYFDVSYQSATGTFIVGFPRPTYDLFATSTVTAISPRFAVEDIGVSRSRTTYGTMNQPKYLPYGAVFTSDFDALTMAASVHGVPNYDTTIAGYGAAYTQGIMTYGAAVEAVFEGDDLLWNWKAQMQASQDWGTWAVTVFDGAANGSDAALEVGVTANASAKTTLQTAIRCDVSDNCTVQTGGRYDVTDAIGVAGAVGRSAGGNSIDLALTYRF